MRRKNHRMESFLYLERDPYHDVLPRLEPRSLRSLSRELPDPVAEYRGRDVAIDIFKAKDLYHPTWKNPSVFRLVIDARGSYYRYGDHPPLDELDRKSAVYLARARSLPGGAGKSGVPLEEWHSLRYIPWRGTPYGFDDAKLCAYKGKTVDAWMQQKFPGVLASQALVSISRVCGIAPYPQRAQDDRAHARRARHDHTALCFAAMNNEFFNVEPHARDEFRYVSTLMHRTLVRKALTVKRRGIALAPKFIPAHRTLGLATTIGLHREGFAASYCRRFPQYFLDTPKLVAFLQGLVAERALSHETLRHYLGDSVTPEELLRYDGVHITALRGLGNLFSAEGTLVGARISGEDLRRRAGRVPDGPALQLMDVRQWQKSAAALCRHGRLERKNESGNAA